MRERDGNHYLISSKDNNMPTPPKPEQDIMNEGPGLKDRARETSAVLNTVAPSMPAAPAPTTKGTAVDKVNPKGKYGTGKDEKRIPEAADWAKPLGSVPSYKDGTDFVPKTGPAILHKGEKVTPAKDNPMKNVYDKITEGDAKPPKKLKSIHTRKAADGSYIHEHHHHFPEHHKMEEHTSPDDKSMLAHLTEHAPTMGAEAPAMPAGPQGADQAMAGATGAPPQPGQ
jgi:hypothetical protein